MLEGGPVSTVMYIVVSSVSLLLTNKGELNSQPGGCWVGRIRGEAVTILPIILGDSCCIGVKVEKLNSSIVRLFQT